MRYVSIPYGTIKRAVAKSPKNAGAVSIPYGTIKSVGDAVRMADGSLFQFLMVRLKGSQGREQSLICKNVSIPYGTIKSAVKSEKRVHFLVSIPYGTIKSSVKLSASTRNARFNSLWYD